MGGIREGWRNREGGRERVRVVAVEAGGRGVVVGVASGSRVGGRVGLVEAEWEWSGSSMKVG